MGTIIKPKLKDGCTASIGQIAIRRRPVALNNVRVGHHKRRGVTLGDAMDKHVDDSAKAIGRTKSVGLKSIKNFDIAGKPCAEIGRDDSDNVKLPVADERGIHLDRDRLELSSGRERNVRRLDRREEVWPNPEEPESEPATDAARA